MTAQDIRTAPITALPSLTPLQTALLKCRTPILDSYDVQTFKAERLKQELAKLANFEPKSFRRARVTCVAVAAILEVLGCYVPFRSVAGFRDSPFAMLSLLIAGLLVCTFAGFFAVIARRLRPGGMLEWRTYQIGHCDGSGSEIRRSFRGLGLATWTHIPDKLVVRMELIATTGVPAMFEVDQLDADPFLWVVADYGNERYCIGVWDERGFIR